MPSNVLDPVLHYVRRTAEAAGAHPLNDADLLRRFVTERDESAFAALVRRHSRLVLAACRAVLINPSDVEDAFQATFLVLVRKADTIRWQMSIGNWLFGVAHRISVRARADANRRRVREGQAGEQADKVEGPPDLTWREAAGILHEELDRLPEAYRLPLLLCYIQGLSRDEAARQLGWPATTVKGRLESGRKRLRARLTRRGIELSAGLLAVLTADPCRAASPSLVRTAIQLAVGGVPPATVAALARGVPASLVAGPVKLAAGLLLAVGMLAGVAGLPLRSPAGATPADPTPPQAAAPVADDTVAVTGRVLDPEGKPVAGAQIRLWSESTKDRARVRATTGPDGRFRLVAAPADAAKGATVAASAEGFGPDWVRLGDPAPGELTLRLAKDSLPVQGRLLTLEGRPVSGATVRILRLQKPNSGDLTAWIEARKKGQYPNMPSVRPADLGLPATVTTDPDGRFRLTGFGQERVLPLLIQNPQVEQTEIWVLTREGLPAGLRGGRNGTYAATFEHLAGPGRSILGTVREKGTGRPIPGVTILSFTYSQITVTTDEQGRYRIDGASAHDNHYSVSAGSQLPYFNSTRMNIPAPPGLGPLTVDFELEKGLVIRGRLTDKVTGQPVRGRVGYASTPDNPHLKDFPDIGKPQFHARDTGRVGPDGSFSVLAIPGPGALNVRADDPNAFTRTPPPEGLKLGNLILEGFHAVVPVDPSANDSKSLVCDLTLEPGRTLSGTVLGPDGQPITGYYAVGLSPVTQFLFGRQPDPINRAEIQVGGLGSQPRGVVIVHPTRKLAKVLSVRGDEPSPWTVRLEPLGGAAGRVVDGSGKPLAGLQVAAALSARWEDYKTLPLDLVYDYPSWDKVLRVRTTTDADGRFRLDGLVPGLSYDVRVTANEGRQAVCSVDGIKATSGETKNLGDVHPSK